MPLSITLVSPCAQVCVHRPVEPKPPAEASFLQFTFLAVSAVFDHVEFCIIIIFFGYTRPLVFGTLLYLASFPTSLIFDFLYLVPASCTVNISKGLDCNLLVFSLFPLPTSNIIVSFICLFKYVSIY